MTRWLMQDSAKRYYRHGEAFWRDLIARQAPSGQGVRKFCQANGVPTGTFHKWRATLAASAVVAAQTLVTTPDPMFIAIAHESEGIASLPSEPSRTPSSRSGTRDSVIVTSGGTRAKRPAHTPTISCVIC
jgi:hypothetical protein